MSVFLAMGHSSEGFHHTGLDFASVVFLRLLFAFLLESLELFEIGFVLIADAALLESQVAQVAAISEENFAADDVFANGGVGLLGVQIGEFDLTDGVDACFQSWDAQNAPFTVGDHLDEGVFFVSGGREAREVTVEVCLVGDGVVGW